MKLRQAHALGVFDDHQGGIGHIYADFDDGGGDQDVQPPEENRAITSAFSAAFMRPCTSPILSSGNAV